MDSLPSYSRDLRLDFFRGLALLCIFVDHVPGNRLTSYTIRNAGLSDASELFVFIAACSAGLVYMGRLRRDGLMAVLGRIWRRAAQIYGAHLLLLVAVAYLANWLTRVLRDPQYINGLNVRPFLDRPGEMVLPALTLTYQPTFMNILPLYVVLVAGLPFMLWLISQSRRLALLLSLALYVAVRQWPDVLWTPLGTPIGTAWQFNPFAWQLLFVIGVTLGSSAAMSRTPVPHRTSLLIVSAVFATGAFWVGAGAWDYNGLAFGLPRWLDVVIFPVMERANLSLWRLANILALSYLVTWAIGRDSAILRWRVSRAVIACGQHSLPLFCLGVVLSVVGWAALARFGSGLATQVAVNVLGFGLMLAAARVLSKGVTATWSESVR